MKYISIDLEFTSLNLEDAKILEIGAIVEDTENQLSFEECPKFHCYVNHSTLTGNVYALAMNSDILRILAKQHDFSNKSDKDDYIRKNNIISEHEVSQKFLEFLCDANMVEPNTKTTYIKVNNGKCYPTITNKFENKIKLVLAGKNLQSKDIPLLKKLPHWNNAFDVTHRFIDPAILYVNWKIDTTLPNLLECKRRANLEDRVSHKAIDDAWDIIMLLRNKY